MELRRATEADEAGILDLATRTLGWDGSPRFAGLYRWKHDENAFGSSPRWVAVEDGAVVGFRVLMRWRFRTPGGGTVDAVRAVDTATDPAHQGKGIFTKLTLAALDDLEAEGVGFVFNTPNDKSRPGYLKMGWVELGRAGMGVLPARLSGVARMLRARVPAELWSEEPAFGLHPEEAFADDAPVAELLEKRAPSHRLETDLSAAVLRWRYGHEPLRYRVVPLGADLAEGCAVVRLRRRGPALEAAAVEVLVPAGSRGSRGALLRRVARRSGADYVICASSRAVETVPLASLPGLGPLVTWRRLRWQEPPGIDGFAFSLGDLELF